MATSNTISSYAHPPRRSERHGVCARIQYRRSTVRMAGVTLNLSCHGVRLAAMERLRIGEPLWITLPGLPPRRAVVKWVEAFEVGCEFDAPLHEALLDRILADA
jgi:hypothetical protein